MLDLKFLEVLPDEETYRAHPGLNYSKIKAFITKPLLVYKKKYIDKIDDEEDNNSGMQKGTLVDLRLLGKEEDFEKRFFVAEMPELPKPQYLRFCEHLLSLDNEEPFGDRCLKSYQMAGITTPHFPKFMENFKENGAEDYYNTLVEAKGKTIITFGDLETADFAVNVLKTDENTKHIFVGDGFNQLPIVFEYQEIVYKILVDRIKISHFTKEINPFDLKTSYDVEGFDYQYLKMRYDIQDALYSLGVNAWAKANYPGYKVNPFSFVVLDVPAYHRPLVYSFNYSGLNNPWHGFTHRGRKYKGISKAVADMAWHESTDEWRITRDNLLKKGILSIQIGD